MVLSLPPLASAQSIHGVVHDTAGAPVRDAIVALVDSLARLRQSERTDGAGMFELKLPPSGRFTILVRRLGFAPKRIAVEAGASAAATPLDIVLVGAPVRLSAVTIKAQRDSLRQTRVFGMDLRTIGGTIITPAQIDQSVLGARDILDVFSRQSVIGFTVDEDQHCIVHNRGFPRECLPAVVDGLLVADGHALRDMVAPEIIDYMMVLRGHEVGVLFGSVSEQGIVVVVTKMGIHRGPR
ncbi:MAG: carboxypeptidase-like regulatory domain-containing protein [Gemmatimonadaceae bacterium]